MSLRFGWGVVSVENIVPTPTPIPLPEKKEVSLYSFGRQYITGAECTDTGQVASVGIPARPLPACVTLASCLPSLLPFALSAERAITVPDSRGYYEHGVCWHF